MAATVRIDPTTHAALVKIAKAKRLTLMEALARAVEAYRREAFLQAVDEGFAAMRDDPTAWAEERAERAAWDSTSADGLDDE